MECTPQFTVYRSQYLKIHTGKQMGEKEATTGGYPNDKSINTLLILHASSVFIKTQIRYGNILDKLCTIHLINIPMHKHVINTQTCNYDISHPSCDRVQFLTAMD